jgi:hypothetical protein
VAEKINRDRAFGQKLNVDSTPTVYLNDTKLSGEETTDLVQGEGAKLMDKLDAALKAAGVEPPKRTE